MALVAIAIGLVVGVGIGYRLGSAPATTATPGPSGVAGRVQHAFEATMPADWAVCEIGGDVTCHELGVTVANPAVPPSEYGLGWYGWRSLTSVAVKQVGLAVAGRVGHGTARAWLDRVGPGDTFLETTRLTSGEIATEGTLYLNLGVLRPGHYVVETDFRAFDPAESQTATWTYVVGFVVG